MRKQMLITYSNKHNFVSQLFGQLQSQTFHYFQNECFEPGEAKKMKRKTGQVNIQRKEFTSILDHLMFF